MFGKLLQFEIYYQLKQRAFPLLALLFLVFGFFLGGQGFAEKGVHFNSAYQVYFHTGIFTLGSVFIIMFFAISATLRDRQHAMEGLIYSTSIQKKYFFWSRFLGTYLFSVLAFSPFLIGCFLGGYVSDLDPNRMGEFHMITYVQPWLYMVLPNLFVCAAMIYAVSILTKSSIATYTSAIFIYMLYFVGAIFSNSPFLAQSTPASQESMFFGALIDTFGVSTFFEQTYYWTALQKNTELLSFSGLFLANRLLWIFIALCILLITYRVFSFRKSAKKVQKKSKQSSASTSHEVYKPIDPAPITKSNQATFFALLKLELRQVFRGLPFIAVLVMWGCILCSALFSRIVTGGEYNISQYPFTSELIYLFSDELTFFSLILIIFYSAEMVWREREMHFNSIIDATPVKNSVLFLSKFIALVALPMLLITIAVLICIAFQIALDHAHFDLDLYASLYYHYGLQLVIFCMIALFVHSLAKSKYMGMGIFGCIVLLALKSNMIGLEHPLTSLGLMPKVSYNEMDGFYKNATLFNHLALYWGALGLLLITMAFKNWNRGEVSEFSRKLKQLFTYVSRKQKIVTALLLLVFFGSGTLVYYHTNVISSYETKNNRLNFKENYERKFKQFALIDRLYVTSKKTNVAIYPANRMYTVDAAYILKNKSEHALKELFITERLPLKHISIENASLVSYDSIYGTYLFQYNTPLQPNDSIRYTFALTKEVKGYEKDISIVNNGTYINRMGNFEPILGYTTSFEIKDASERRKRNLPKREHIDDSDEHITIKDVKHEKIRFETIISTSSNQTAISSGQLINQWTENDRNYFHYKTSKKILPEVGYLSADYTKKKTNYKGISIEQYFDANHEFNIEEIDHSVKQTLDYCQENFGIYNFDYLRIAEVPSYWPFGGFAHPGVITMVENNLYLKNVSNDEDFNLVSKRVIHEVSHQWWAHTLSAKPVPGGSLFVEGFAKYTEAVVLEKMYGKGVLYALAEDVRMRYFKGRTYTNVPEPPVYRVDGQNYISYGKSLTVMLALKDLIGEDRVNNVMKTLTDKYRSINKLAITSLEFLEEIYKNTPIEQHELVNDWFKKVITYDLDIQENSSYVALNNGTFEVTIQVKAKRFETLNNGNVQAIKIDEPIKIGVFTAHPSLIKNENAVLHYQSHRINKEMSEIKLIVNKKPKYIAIDPYGTRLDQNLVDNVMRL